MTATDVRPRFEWTRQPGVGPLVAILGDLRGRIVVELGCGSGHNLAHLVTHHGARGIGVDHAAGKVSRARSLYGDLPDLDFVLDDAAAYLNAAEPGSVDVCLSVFGAFSFSEPHPLLAATARVLRPGGSLALTLRLDEQHDRVAVLRRRGHHDPPTPGRSP